MKHADATSPSLLPCPHCGKQPTFYRCGGYDTFQSVIACCGLSNQDFEDALVKAWNERAPVSETLVPVCEMGGGCAHSIKCRSQGHCEYERAIRDAPVSATRSTEYAKSAGQSSLPAEDTLAPGPAVSDQRHDKPSRLPTVNDLLTMLDELDGIQAGYETADHEAAKRLVVEQHDCRKRIMALFTAAQLAKYPSAEDTPSATRRTMLPPLTDEKINKVQHYGLHALPYEERAVFLIALCNAARELYVHGEVKNA